MPFQRAQNAAGAAAIPIKREQRLFDDARSSTEEDPHEEEEDNGRSAERVTMGCVPSEDEESCSVHDESPVQRKQSRQQPVDRAVSLLQPASLPKIIMKKRSARFGRTSLPMKMASNSRRPIMGGLAKKTPRYGAPSTSSCTTNDDDSDDDFILPGKKANESSWSEVETWSPRKRHKLTTRRRPNKRGAAVESSPSHPFPTRKTPKKRKRVRKTLSCKSSTPKKKSPTPKKTPKKKKAPPPSSASFRYSQHYDDDSDEDELIDINVETQDTNESGGGGELVEVFDNGEEFWEVEKVLEHRVVKGKKNAPEKLEYRLQWANYNAVDPVWYPEENLTEKAVELYHSLRKKREDKKKEKHQLVSNDNSYKDRNEDLTIHHDVPSERHNDKDDSGDDNDNGFRSDEPDITNDAHSPSNTEHGGVITSEIIPSPTTSDTMGNENNGVNNDANNTDTLQEEAMDWDNGQDQDERVLDCILEHQEISKNTRTTFAYRLKWHGFDDIDPEFYPAEDVCEKTRQEYWSRCHAQQQHEEGEEIVRTSKQPTTNSEDPIMNIGGGVLENNSLAEHSERIFSDIELDEGNNEVGKRDVVNTSVPACSGTGEAAKLGAPSLSAETNSSPAVSPNEHAQVNQSRNDKHVAVTAQVPVDAIRQTLLSCTRCPSCSSPFSTELQSDHFPYMSKGCSHTICNTCVSNAKNDLNVGNNVQNVW